MEEIFSGTEWAQFLSANSSTMHQSKELPNTNYRSQEEELRRKWTHEDTTNSHLDWTQPSFPESFAQDMASDKRTETSQMNVPFTNQSQNTNLNPNESHNSEQSNRQSHYSQLDPNEQKASEYSDPQPMSSHPSHNQPQHGTEDYIPLVDLSYAKVRV